MRDIHKLLRNCFGQAVKWELMEKNPCINATVPKAKREPRKIWDAKTLFHAIEICEDERLKLALNLAFSCTLRMGELLGLTWDCIDISPTISVFNHDLVCPRVLLEAGLKKLFDCATALTAVGKVPSV